MDKFANKIERILTPFGAKLQKVTFMQAISEALQATLPILIVGSFATLISSLDVGPWQGIVKSIPGLLPVCQKITLFTSGGALVMWPGLHASTISAFIQPLALTASAATLVAWNLGKALPNVIKYSFMQSSKFGGGANLLLPCLIALLFVNPNS